MDRMNAWIDNQLDLLELYPKKTVAMRHLIKMNRALKGKEEFVDDPSKHRESKYWSTYFSPRYKKIKKKKLQKKFRFLSKEEFRALQKRHLEELKRLEEEKRNALKESVKAEGSKKSKENAPPSPKRKKAEAPAEVTKTKSLVKNKKPTPKKRPPPNLLKATVIKEAKRRSGEEERPEKKKKKRSANIEEFSESGAVKPK